VIVVDTSVWIDVLNGNNTAKARRCIELLEDGAPLALTDVVFAELLQGLRSRREAQRVERHLRLFPIIRLETLDDFSLAADLYRRARSAGLTIRRTLDCLIAAPCIREGFPILHADQDFDRLASCTELTVFS
jgi:predicted nucleic acid-binding protein